MEANKNCFTCKLLKTNNFIFGTADRPCDYYPKELSTAADIIGGYYCEHHDQVDIKYLDIPKYSQNEMQMFPFFISSLNAPMISPEKEVELAKIRQSIERDKRFLDWAFGFFVGISIGLLLLLITIKL